MTLMITIVLLCAVSVYGKERKSIEAYTRGMTRMEGLFPLYWDAEKGRMLVVVRHMDKEFLYIHSLATGIGSNPIGLDRGKLGRSHILRFHREGPRVLLMERNLRYRAISSSKAEVRSVHEAFAQSVLWGGDILAETGDEVLVDMTEFFLSDQQGIGRRLQGMKEGHYRVDRSRSAFYMERTKNFPKNTEIEVMLTLKGDLPGPQLMQTVPTPRYITIREHHSFVALPDKGYRPRRWDPRSGFFGIEFMDFATPVSDRLVRRWIARHRLIPGKDSSRPVKPIVYYVDSGAPEPVRSALIEGASWWGRAFERAGFRNAFEVRVLPEDVDPMDIRYNVIQWVHRATRGWSYGQSVVDPRTGEIIKGHVLLGSQRVRQDYMIAEGLLAPYKGNHVPPDMLEMALARIRQLAAHEVGHTLGLRHNFAASPRGRASVMDYPHPLIKIRDGNIDLSDAYAVGVGAWDIFAIRYGYTYFPDARSETEGLKGILEEARRAGLIFISDPDARAPGTANAEAHLWDNGMDPVTELKHLMKVRAVALRHFDASVIRWGEPMARLEEVLVPIYMLHRYQIQAASKLIGGLYFEYAVRGRHLPNVKPVAAEKQRAALATLLDTLEPDQLRVPPSLLRLIPPGVEEAGQSREIFTRRTGRPFDPTAPAEALANHVMTWLLEVTRINRIYTQAMRDAALPGLDEVLNTLIKRTLLHEPYPEPDLASLHRKVNAVTIYHLMRLIQDKRLAEGARAVVWHTLQEITGNLKNRARMVKSTAYRSHYLYLANRIEQFIKNPNVIAVPEPAPPPPGEPIGMTDDFDLICPVDLCSH